MGRRHQPMINEDEKLVDDDRDDHDDRDDRDDDHDDRDDHDDDHDRDDRNDELGLHDDGDDEDDDDLERYEFYDPNLRFVGGYIEQNPIVQYDIKGNHRRSYMFNKVIHKRERIITYSHKRRIDNTPW